MANFDEIRIVEGGDVFVLLDTEDKIFVLTDLETANKLTDFESTNNWVKNAEDIYVNDLTSYVDELIDMFGYAELEEFDLLEKESL